MQPVPVRAREHASAATGATRKTLNSKFGESGLIWWQLNILSEVESSSATAIGTSEEHYSIDHRSDRISSREEW